MFWIFFFNGSMETACLLHARYFMDCSFMHVMEVVEASGIAVMP